MDFKKIVTDKIDAIQNNQNIMLQFSEELSLAMSLSSGFIREALLNDVVWHIRGYEITCRSFPWNEWTPLLIATPAEIGAIKLGYTNCQETLPSGWHYDQKGTATTFYPDESTRKEIIDIIKSA